MFGFLFFSFLLFSDSIQDDSESATVGLILAFWLSFSHPVFLVSLRTRQLRIKVRTNAHTGGRLITKTNKKLIDWVLITAAGRSIVLLLLLLVECQNQSSSLLVLFYEEKKLPACLLISIPFFFHFLLLFLIYYHHICLSVCVGCWAVGSLIWLRNPWGQIHSTWTAAASVIWMALRATVDWCQVDERRVLFFLLCL